MGMEMENIGQHLPRLAKADEADEEKVLIWGQGEYIK